MCHGIAAFSKAGKIYVLLTRGSKGLFVYRFTPGNKPQIDLIGSVKRYAESPSSSGRLIGITYDVAVLQIAASTYALIGTSDGLYVADVTPPNTPSVVGCLLKRGVSSATAAVRSIAVQGTTAYLAQAWLGVQVGVRVVDVSRPVGAGSYGN